jgi:thiamine-monophosphate kinase
MDEFSIIQQYFNVVPQRRDDVVFGIGDDAASVRVPSDKELLISTDTLVSNVHFLPEWDAYDIACKAVLVNVSDIAAMAATPCWATLALTLPNVNEDWLASFARGIHDSLAQYEIDLIGGDTTCGPLSMTLTLLGVAPVGKSIRRNGARPGDVILVTGQLGAASLAVSLLKAHNVPKDDKILLMDKLLHPNPRVDFSALLQRFATSAIDISDGLSADLSHICSASRVGATLARDAIPLHPLLPIYLKDKAVDMALTGGDDYELCFTLPPHYLGEFLAIAEQQGLVCYTIGMIDKAPGLRLTYPDGQCVTYEPKGYSHF